MEANPRRNTVDAALRALIDAKTGRKLIAEAECRLDDAQRYGQEIERHRAALSGETKTHNLERE